MFDRPIEISAYSQERDEYNERTMELVPIAFCYANKKDNAGRKMVDAGAVIYTDDVEYTIRWRKDIRQGHFLKDSGERYEIIAIREIDRRKLLRLVCRYIYAYKYTDK